MTILPSHMYRDPLDQIIADESKTCKGCKHWTKMLVCGEPKMLCEKGRKARNSKCFEEMPGKIYCQGGK